jgi:hypothetical protein
MITTENLIELPQLMTRTLPLLITFAALQNGIGYRSVGAG